MYCRGDEIPEIQIQRVGECSCDKKRHLSALFWCGVKREFEEKGYFSVCVGDWWVCGGGDQDICTGFEEVSHGTGTILNPPSWTCKRGFGPLLALRPQPQQ